MTRTMYDSVTAAHIPTSAWMVAGYLPPSRYAWSAADWARFPNAVKVRIAIFANVNDGHVLDVEPGDATPAQAPGWVMMRRRAGADPTVYCSASSWPAVRQAFRDARVPEPHYWIARYDNIATIPAGAVAKQYANPETHGQGHYDLSVVADYWPGVDSPQPQEDDMDATERGWLEEAILRLRSMHTGQWGPPTGTEAGAGAGGDLTWFQKQLAPLMAKVDQLAGELSDDEANIIAAVRAIPAGDVDEGALAAALAPLLAPLIEAGATSAEVEAAVRRVFASAGTSPL